MITQIDMFESLGPLVGSAVETEDSENLLDILMGKSNQGREGFILEATSRTALRKGDWFMIPPYKEPAIEKNVNIELGNLTDYQLYNLKEDQGEQTNLADSDPEKLAEMIQVFEAKRGKNNRQI